MRLVDSPMTLVLAAIGAPVRMVALSCAAVGIASRGMMHATPLAVSASWNATRAVMRTPTDRDTGERCMLRIVPWTTVAFQWAVAGTRSAPWLGAALNIRAVGPGPSPTPRRGYPTSGIARDTVLALQPLHVALGRPCVLAQASRDWNCSASIPPSNRCRAIAPATRGTRSTAPAASAAGSTC